MLTFFYLKLCIWECIYFYRISINNYLISIGIFLKNIPPIEIQMILIVEFGNVVISSPPGFFDYLLINPFVTRQKYLSDLAEIHRVYSLYCQ